MKEYWYEQLKQNAKTDAIFAVAANKSELYNQQQVSNEEEEEFAEIIGAWFFCTSSLIYDDGIDEMF